MPRHYDDWIKAFMEYASHTEAPKYMHFWTAVSTIAGALRRKVWMDEGHYKFIPNFYVIFVAPPGIVSKSTTAAIGMDLLRQVEGVKFGPEIVTWQALVVAFANATETFEFEDAHWPMSSLTLESSEFGNLVDPKDKQMIDLLVSLWDGKQGSMKKETKTNGSEAIVNPWINIIACTTPAWIAGNFPEYMIGGGFTSRCIFVYAEEKEKLVAYGSEHLPPDFHERQKHLVSDLSHISKAIAGPYILTPEAKDWGRKWYKYHYENRPQDLDQERFGGYIARKQAHLHKLAMILTASKTDARVIDQETLALAEAMVTDLEADMVKVFSKIGRSSMSAHAERLLAQIKMRVKMTYSEAYRFVHTQFPNANDFENVIIGFARAGFVKLVDDGTAKWIVYNVERDTPVVNPGSADIIAMPNLRQG